jgi:ABC-type branched-subunit amino acid transport system substrate-binding protein
LEILRIYYKEGEFKEVIRKASQAIEIADSKAHLRKIYILLGDTYIALGSLVDATLFYTNALQMSDRNEEQLILALGEEDIVTLLMMDDEVPKDRLLYQLALILYKEENYAEAEKLFLEFIKIYPAHDKALQAKNLIEEIRQRTDFNRHLIGCLLPLSGPYENFGKRALRAIELALDQYNARLSQSKFGIIVKDTRSDPDYAIEALRRLDEERVALIIGPIVTSEAAARESQKRSIPIITLTQKPGIVEIGDYVFRNFLTPEMQIEAIVPFAIEKLGIQRFAILYPDENYGHTFMKMFRDKVMNYGAEISGMESYHPDQTDFAGPISKLANIKLKDWRSKSRNRKHKRFEVVVDFDAIFIPDSPEKTGLIAPQLAFYDVDDVLLLGTNLWHSDDLIKEAGKYVQFALMADGYYADTSKKTVNDFIMAFMERYGEPPGIVEAFAYDTAMMAFQTADNSAIRSRQDLKNELKNLYNYDGVTGVTSFSENGEADKKLYLLQIDGDKFVELNSY